MAADEFDPKILADIRRSLEELDELRVSTEAYLRAPVEPGSLEVGDRALPDARYVVIYAGQALGAAIDHLTAWRAVIHGPVVPMQAHFTLLRGAIEGSTRSRWHVDASQDSGTRVGRGIAARREDQLQRKGFEASLARIPKPTSPTGRTAAQRVAELDARPAAIARRDAGIRSVPYDGTTAVAKAFGLEAVYRLTSGLAHGREWALAGLVLHQEAGSPGIAPGVGHGRFTTSEPLSKYVSDAALSSTRRAVDDLRRYREQSRS